MYLFIYLFIYFENTQFQHNFSRDNFAKGIK